MQNFEQWREYELKDARGAKQQAVNSGNLDAVQAAEVWIAALATATAEQVARAAADLRSIAPGHRRRAIECLGSHNNGGRPSMGLASVEAGR